MLYNTEFVEAEEDDTEKTEFTHYNHTQAERSKRANKSKLKGDSEDFKKIWTAINEVQHGKTGKGNIGRITNYFKRITEQEAESVISVDQVNCRINYQTRTKN